MAMMLQIRRRTWVPAADDARTSLKSLLETGVAVLDLNVRTLNALEKHNIIRISELLRQPPAQLLAIPNFGTKTLVEVFEALGKVGFDVQERLEMAKKGQFRTRKDANKNGKSQTKKTHNGKAGEDTLSAAAALKRCVEDIDVIVGNLLDEDPESLHAKNLIWVMEYAKSRKPCERCGICS